MFEGWKNKDKRTLTRFFESVNALERDADNGSINAAHPEGMVNTHLPLCLQFDSHVLNFLRVPPFGLCSDLGAPNLATSIF